MSAKVFDAVGYRWRGTRVFFLFFFQFFISIFLFWETRV